MDLAFNVAQVAVGGVIGAAATQLATWVRERRRNREVYRAPQRDAIAALMVAHNEMKIAASAIGDALVTELSHEDTSRILDALVRGLMETDRAFAVCRLVVAEPETREKLASAQAEFDKLALTLNHPLAGQMIANGGEPYRRFIRKILSTADLLEAERIELISIAEKRLGAVAPLSSGIRHKFNTRRRRKIADNVGED
ncbi:hypothetical protein ACLQ3K_16090 [Tsukamurella sp. DT100]|uniref:hypothetical protein n=1 Tax=Tsukamurella sp. DT100 TaxID=3393415 RepID=UPI003CEEF8C0